MELTRTDRTISISGPSGVGKNTVIHGIQMQLPWLTKTRSVTTRKPREGDPDNAYYYVSVDEFVSYIGRGEFVEYEEVYEGVWYGTLKSEIQQIQGHHHIPLFEIDVTGAQDIKDMYGTNHCSILLVPPSVEVLKERLIERKSESIEQINKRVNKAEWEINQQHLFDQVVVNDQLDVAISQCVEIISSFCK